MAGPLSYLFSLCTAKMTLPCIDGGGVSRFYCEKWRGVTRPSIPSPHFGELAPSLI